MSIELTAVERELARLWEIEAQRSSAPRIELLTLVALASEPGLLDRAQKAAATVACTWPLRTIVARWTPSDTPAITAEASLHRASRGGVGGVGGGVGDACGDAILVEAAGSAREWLPENIDRLTLPDLPVCVWWLGDLPDYDRLFDRMVVNADLVVVNSAEMDLRDLHKLAGIAVRSRSREACALTDMMWVRLRPLQELIARFFDDETACGCLNALERVTIEFSPRQAETDVASTQAGLLFGWIAHVLGLASDSATWKRGTSWGEATLARERAPGATLEKPRVVARFEHRPRPDVPPGSILRVAIECDGARFEIERQEDPHIFRWSREAPGAPVPPQTLRVGIPEETTLLARCLEHPRRDRLFEKSLGVASRLVRSVAPRLSGGL